MAVRSTSVGRAWIGVDLDGTIARYEGWQGALHIGAPIPLMVARVREWLKEGQSIRIFTARVAEPDETARAAIIEAIGAWCEEHIGERLPVTNIKDYAMVELWDDRAVQVVQNTGIRADGT